jgi:tRNA C32,U32 (ribose-2'-O)-methylase TrmJ
MASPEDMERMYVHLAQVLEEIDFRDRTPGGTNLMSRIRRFLQRAELDKNEVNIVRGILTATQKRRRQAGDPHVGKDGEVAPERESPERESPEKDLE